MQYLLCGISLSSSQTSGTRGRIRPALLSRVLEGAGLTGVALILVLMCGCAALGGAPSKGLAEANFSLSNGYTVGIEAFTHPAVDGECKTLMGHPSPGLPRMLATSITADDCASANFNVAPGYVESVVLSGMNCRFGDSSYECNAKLEDTDTGELLAEVSTRQNGWYSALPQLFAVHKVISGHLKMTVEQHAEGKSNYAHQDYPAGQGTVAVRVTTPDGLTMGLNATLTHPGPDDSPVGTRMPREVKPGVWIANVITKQNAATAFAFGARNWPSIKIASVASEDANPYEISVIVEDPQSGAILAYENYKATGAMVRPSFTYPIQGPTSGMVVLSVYMWEVHSANWLNPPLGTEALDVLMHQ